MATYAIGELVPVINRTKHIVDYVYDGTTYELKPGESKIPAEHLVFARKQNPVMGTNNPYNPSQFDSLISVKGSRQKQTPVTLEMEHASIESIDRSMLPFDRQKTRLMDFGRPMVTMGGPEGGAEFVANDD